MGGTTRLCLQLTSIWESLLHYRELGKLGGQWLEGGCEGLDRQKGVRGEKWGVCGGTRKKGATELRKEAGLNLREKESREKSW